MNNSINRLFLVASYRVLHIDVTSGVEQKFNDLEVLGQDAKMKRRGLRSSLTSWQQLSIV
jgi:hypothetical protein